MDTNLKKGKKIRAFCYRLFALGSLAIMLASAIVGRDAIPVLISDAPSALSGSFYEMPEFKNYISELCYYTLLAHAGVGDRTGSSLSEHFHTQSARVQSDAKTYFRASLHKADPVIQYYIRLPNRAVTTNMPYTAFSDNVEDALTLLPPDTVLCYFWDGLQSMEYSALRTGLRYIHGYNSSMPYQPLNHGLKQIRVVIAVNTGQYQLSAFLSGLQRQAQNYRLVLLFFLISGGAALLSLPFCFFSRKAYREASCSYAAFSGKILLEFKLTAIVLLLLLLFYRGFSLKALPALSCKECLWQILSALPFILLLFLLYTDIRHNKTKFLLHSLPGRFSIYIKELWKSTSWYRRSMLIGMALMAGIAITFITGVCLIAALSLSVSCQAQDHYPEAYELYRHKYAFLSVSILLFLTSFLLFAAYRHTRKLVTETKAVSDKLAGLKDGVKTAPLVLQKNALLKQTAADVNALEDGMEKMAEQKNRSNRLRVELITNVSHDLKTPLTSIINYADLLCEEPLEENAAGYAASLREKAYRLRSMVQDVFTLSKASSGSLPVEKHTLDLVKLVCQTLADMDSRIQESSLTFKTIISEEPLLIEADGDKLYRIFQNLIVNALQYSLENSRVYVILSIEDGKACAKIKNTSKWELDFDTKDIMERFVRADASRTTEGSGLGLSIAQSFTELFGGSFSIATDADMFTACVQFPLTEKNIPENTEPPFTVSAPYPPAAPS